MTGYSPASRVLYEPPSRRARYFAIVVGAHALLFWAGMELSARPAVQQMAREMMVSLIDSPASAPEQRPPEPPPQPARLQPPMPQLPTIPVVVLDAPAAPTITAAPPVTAPVADAAPAAPAVVVAARFDADYLSNPKPVYPPSSYRLGEEGKVWLRVKVSPGGTPLAIEIKQSSGFARLDDAARAAVERWKFVPARRGDEAIESWVNIPVVFSLQAA